MQRRATRWTTFVEHVQTAPGSTGTETRRRIFTAARYQSGDVTHDEPLLAFATEVAERSYRITDDTVAALHESGHSDDQIFEAIVVASTGAADRRLGAARRALGWH